MLDGGPWSSRQLNVAETERNESEIERRPVGTRRRVVSVDVLRGLTMAVMIFVNDLDGVRGLPAWTYHMPKNVDAMSYVDVVFPVFLFIAGLAIPLAVRNRLTKNPSLVQFSLHVAYRVAGLVVLGLILANAGKVGGGAMGLQSRQWALFALVGVGLFWNAYPASVRGSWPVRVLRVVGLALLILCLVTFRRTLPGGGTGGLDSHYWEILGLIGWAYLGTCLLYVPTRRWRWASTAWLVLLIALNVSVAAHWVRWPTVSPAYLWPWGSGAFSLMMMAGVVVSQILFSEAGAEPFRVKARRATALAGVLAVAGWLLTPLGISKIRETSTWCLYSGAIGIVCLLIVYWMVDEKQWRHWTWLLESAGSNPLTTYLLPDVYYFVFGELGAGTMWAFGLPGIAKAGLFTVAMLLVARWVTRLGLRLQL